MSHKYMRLSLDSLCSNIIDNVRQIKTPLNEDSQEIISFHQISIHSASADTSADMSEVRFSKLNILLKHSRMP